MAPRLRESGARRHREDAGHESSLSWMPCSPPPSPTDSTASGHTLWDRVALRAHAAPLLSGSTRNRDHSERSSRTQTWFLAAFAPKPPGSIASGPTAADRRASLSINEALRTTPSEGLTPNTTCPLLRLPCCRWPPCGESHGVWGTAPPGHVLRMIQVSG